MNREDNPAAKEHLTREEYRRQIKWGHKSAQDLDQQTDDSADPQRPLRRQELHEKDEPIQFEEIGSVDRNPELGDDQRITPTRADSLAMDKQERAEAKSQRLAKKLNITIAILVVLIVVVYLVLFFVK